MLIEKYLKIKTPAEGLVIVKIMNTELKAPKGKIRVVGVDLFSHEDYLVGDFDYTIEAFIVADGNNIRREGPMDDVYYVYDDKGRYLRGNEAVGQQISP